MCTSIFFPQVHRSLTSGVAQHVQVAGRSVPMTSGPILIFCIHSQSCSHYNYSINFELHYFSTLSPQLGLQQALC
jgi:hypothetical protein